MKNKILFFCIVTMFEISSSCLFGASNSNGDLVPSADDFSSASNRDDLNDDSSADSSSSSESDSSSVDSSPPSARDNFDTNGFDPSVLSSFYHDVVIDARRRAAGRRVYLEILASLAHLPSRERMIEAYRLFQLTPYGFDHYYEPDLCVDSLDSEYDPNLCFNGDES